MLREILAADGEGPAHTTRQRHANDTPHTPTQEMSHDKANDTDGDRKCPFVCVKVCGVRLGEH